MPQFARVIAEACLAVLATCFAILVRDNFEVVPGRWEASVPFLVTTGFMCLVVFPAVGIHRGIWRFNSSAELPRLVAAAVGVTMANLLAMFIYDRLASVARAIPLLQFFFILAMLCGVRVLARHRHLSRQSRASIARPLQLAAQPQAQNVIVVGLNRLAETYLLAVTEMAPTRIKVVGLLGRNDHHVGRSIGAYPVIGLPQDIDSVLRDLQVHGVAIDKIVVASMADDLSADAQAALRRLEVSSDIKVQYLADGLGLSLPKRSPSDRDLAEAPVAFQFSAQELRSIAARPYWIGKRVFDVVVALVALIIVSPVMVAIALGVAIGIGRPVFFWQQRPGLSGTAFRVHKFRTMSLTYAADGSVVDDADRTSRFGELLRRTRLDELPQLFNVLSGDMSFVGPRPLLPRDQPEAFRARLLVRPGLTGWAQVVGGRALSPEDKAALDVWYVRNASLKLDLDILRRTVPMILFGEREHDDLVSRAWSDLLQAGIVVGDLADQARVRTS